MSAEAVATVLAGVAISNNGYHDFHDPAIIAGVEAAGLVVINRGHGYRAFSRRAQAALREEYRAGSGFAVPLHATAPPMPETPDYEAAILARQSIHQEL